MKKLAICVPYRNRESHLKKFIPHMDEFFKDKDIEYKIFICNQADDKKFNRGKTKNIAFDVARKEGYDYFAFHDIDLLPEDSSCDYSYPETVPMHISAYLSQNDYKILFPENFGGVVLFTKEQFEEINGYYNDYWNWGAEDDDLLWRCKQKGYIKRDYVGKDIKNKSVASFNGKDSYIEIPLSESLKKMENGDHTISFLIKSDGRADVPPYLFGNENSENISIPILSQHGLSNLTFGNTMSYAVSFWNNKNKGIHPWVKREEDLWTLITYKVDTKEKCVSMYVNGKDVDHQNKMNYEHENKNYYNTPLFIGFRDGPIWTEDSHNYFKGEIAEIGMWQSALNDRDIMDMAESGMQEINKDDCILYYDFSNYKDNIVYDDSGNGNHGIMTNNELKERDIGKLLDLELPYRRLGKYLCLPHESEGLENDKYKQEDGATNEEILTNQVKKGKVDTNKNGLNNLVYKIISQETIYNTHTMINVEC